MADVGFDWAVPWRASKPASSVIWYDISFHVSPLFRNAKIFPDAGSQAIGRPDYWSLGKGCWWSAARLSMRGTIGNNESVTLGNAQSLSASKRSSIKRRKSDE